MYTRFEYHMVWDMLCDDVADLDLRLVLEFLQGKLAATMVPIKKDPMVASGKFRAQSIAYMGLANAVHMGCYECARSATTALFTSDRVGFTSPSALPFATGLVSPCSILLLWLHRRVFDKYGPHRALRTTTLVYASILLTAAAILREHSGFPRRCCQVTVVLLFVTKNSLVHLILAQHWSFLTTLLGPTKAAQSSVWAGVASLVATGAAGGLIGPVAARVGLTGLLTVAAVGLLLVAIGGDVAYRVANKVRLCGAGAWAVLARGSRKPTVVFCVRATH